MRAFDFLKTVGLCEQKNKVLAPVSVLLKLTVFHRAWIKADKLESFEGFLQENMKLKLVDTFESTL